MEKVVTHVGHSAAIILDRAICEIMGVERGSIVQLSFQGTKLVVERTGRAKADAPRKRPKPESVVDSAESIVEPETDENGEYCVPELARHHESAAAHLLRDRGLDERDVAALDPRLPPDVRYPTAVVRLRRAMAGKPSPEDIVVARRVRYLCDVWDDKETRATLVAEAVMNYPWPAENSEDMSAGTGAVAETMPPSG